MEREYIIGIDYKPYDNELIEEMYKKRINGIPLSFWLLDFRKTNTYCHQCASLLSLVIPGSKRVEGRKAILNGSTHSWVEKGEIVYDTTQLAMWNKQAYYERDNPYITKVYTEEEIREYYREILEIDENCKEIYIAWVRDLEKSLPHQPYETYLKAQIEAFKIEQKLDIEDYDEQLVEEILQELQKFYDEISFFINHSR